ncbi:hypothetical protein SK128_000351 [Halocaridina rubra]|uniref:DM domain-containing protein n=1 Tax=Halocaridina rubra TaxID=373956 RepID=A0AAN9AHL7_HALRR
MCRNHGEIKSKRAHKNACPYQNCTCALCNLTRKRRDIMRHQQRVRRSQVTSQQHDEAWEYVIQATAELEFLNKSSATTSCPSSTTTTTQSSSSVSSSSISSSFSSLSASSFISSHHDHQPCSTSTSTSPSPVPTSSSGTIAFKSEVIANTTPPMPVISNTGKTPTTVPEMPPLVSVTNMLPNINLSMKKFTTQRLTLSYLKGLSPKATH